MAAVRLGFGSGGWFRWTEGGATALEEKSKGTMCELKGEW